MGEHRDCVRKYGADEWCPCPCHDWKTEQIEADPRYVKLLREYVNLSRNEAEEHGERLRAAMVETLGHTRVRNELLTKKLAEEEEKTRTIRVQLLEVERDRRAVGEALNQQTDRTMTVLREKAEIAARLEEFERMWRQPITNPRRSARRVELDDGEPTTTHEGSEPPTGGDASGG